MRLNMIRLCYTWTASTIIIKKIPQSGICPAPCAFHQCASPLCFWGCPHCHLSSQRLAIPSLWSRDWDHRDQQVSLVVETETETQISKSRDRDFTRLEFFEVVETETHRDQRIFKLSRPRLSETGKFTGCRDWDSSRLDKSCRDRDFDETFQTVLQKSIG